MNNETVSKTLDGIQKIFANFDTFFWLDTGTLLGIYRDSGLLPWDDDVDLLMWHPGKEKLHKIMKTLSKNFKIYYDKKERGYCLTIFTGEIDITFGLLKPEGEYGYFYFYVPVNLLGRFLNRFFGLTFLRSNLFTEKIVLRYPLHFFEKFKKISFCGREFLIPENTEEYLKFRYGEDWRKPKRDYIWYKDDGALFYE